MTTEISKVKVNKKHGGKEFNSFFHFVGKFEQYQKFNNDTKSSDTLPIWETTTTTTLKPRRVLQFNVLTHKDNRLKIENNGMERQFAYIYSSEVKAGQNIEWEHRFNKEKYPNATYHLMDTDWDRVENLGNQLQEWFDVSGDDVWVEVKGRYEFSSFTGNDGNKVSLVKRMVTSVNKVENGDEIKVAGEKINYVTNFDDPNFHEVNYVNMQIGIRSTYQDEATQDTKVNAVFLMNGTERSVPEDIELMVYYKEPQSGTPLANAFARLNRLDFIEIIGTDNNRVTFTYVDVVPDQTDDDPFADVDGGVTRKERVINGDKKGLEITSFIRGSWIKDMLTEEEIEKHVANKNNNNYDPFSDVDDGKPIEINDDDLPF